MKNKKEWFSGEHFVAFKDHESHFFIFLNKRIKIIPKYSGTAEISKTVSGLLIEEKLWS